MNQYFATLPLDQIGEELDRRVEDYYAALQSNSHLSKIRKAYSMYYGLGDQDSSAVKTSGDQGEHLEIRINHLRSLLSHILVLTTQNRPALKCIAVNSDYASQASSRLGDSLLDYYFKTKNIEKVLKDATEMALITGKGYAVMRWDTNKGDEYGVNPETGAVIYDGDVGICAKSCLEVIQDIYEEDASWYIIRELKNKYDVAAQYPEVSEDVVNHESAGDYNQYQLNNFRQSDDNIIPVYTFYHKRTPAMPNGRYVEFLEGGLALIDGPIPYREPMIFPIYPSRIHGTQLGYTVGFDILSIADANSELISAILTNQATFARQNIWVKQGSGITVRQLEGGLNLIESDEPPQAINLTQTPSEVFKFSDMLEGKMGVLSGINDVLRGTPQASLKSGSALALVASQALAYNSGLQHSYGDLLTSVGNGIIHLLQDYAATPKVAAIVGVASKSMLTQFTGDDLQDIDRVVVEQVNAVSKTTAGRMELANNLLSSGLLTRPEQYLTVIETGTMQPILEAEVTETMCIRQENESLRAGQAVFALMTDLHGNHIRGHKEILADPEARKDPTLVSAVLAHIQEHLDLARTTDPYLLSILREQDIPPQQAPQPGAPAGNPNVGAQAPDMPALPQEMQGTEADAAYQQSVDQLGG